MERLREAQEQISENGIPGLLKALMGGTLMTIAFTLWSGIENLGATIIKPFTAFADGLATLITGSIGGPAVLLEASVRTGVESLTTGLFAAFGVFAYPVAMVSVMLGIWVFAWFWDRIDLSPWGFLTSLR
jgi:hypothetical protein